MLKLHAIDRARLFRVDEDQNLARFSLSQFTPRKPPYTPEEKERIQQLSDNFYLDE